MHGYYIGYKYQRGLAFVDEAKRQELKDYAYELLFSSTTTRSSTPRISTTGRPDRGRQKFLRYNANKALMNLGYESLFPRDETDVNLAILFGAIAQRRREPRLLLGSGSRLRHRARLS